MIILQSIASLFSMILFFSLLGLSITPVTVARKNFNLVPVFGFGALLTISYLISANFKINGADAIGYTFILSGLCLAIRHRQLWAYIKETTQSQYATFAILVLLPIVTLLIPAEINGFQYFFATVNYDFFYNSQDSWYLINHNVLEYDIKNEIITPLNWSANYSGRIAVGLIAAFFAKFLNIHPLSFNSLLLNTIVILFSLSLGTLCLTFFSKRRLFAFITVAAVLLSAAYVQSYTYYSFGQISALPIFVVFCISFKKFLDSTQSSANSKTIWGECLLLALILNTLFFMYAILSIFAGVLAVISYGIVLLANKRQITLTPLLKMLTATVLLFCVARLFIIPESILIFQSWIKLSNTVAIERGHETFIVFSEYLTETLPSILLGLANYPTSTSLVHQWLASIAPLPVIFLIGVGLIVIVASFAVFLSFFFNKAYNLSSRAILISLLSILILFTIYFFFTLSGYGLFKIQTWFMPILLTVYVYYLLENRTTLLNLALKITCAFILLMNFLTSYIYLKDYFVNSENQHFISAKNITGNKDIIDITQKIKQKQIKQTSLMLNNGFDTAWLADQLRDIELIHVIHNAQTLNEKDLAKNPCMEENSESITKLGPMILMNENRSDYNEITPPPVGGNILYQNNSYTLLDPSTLKTFAYVGTGSYPTEVLHKKSPYFPSKFRWVEKGVEIYIYADKDKIINLQFNITPGFVTTANPTRHITVTHKNQLFHFNVEDQKTLSLEKMKLHKGLNCLIIASPDQVNFMPRHYAITRKNISLDPRLLNFAISDVKISEK